MSTFHPKIEPGYPDNCITVDDAVEGIRKVLGDQGFRVTSFDIKCVTAKKATIRLRFDRMKVGQAPSVEATYDRK